MNYLFLKMGKVITYQILLLDKTNWIDSDFCSTPTTQT
ncbi:hypothetical protein B0O79_3312 [Flavobacteriaceae bacterium MAR_2009_75]|nr:hypothetical protein B0O79_3312 [Flavobacteriaceae bacterium MAR_2009_75]